VYAVWRARPFRICRLEFVARFVPETRGRPLESIDKYWAEGRRWPPAGEQRDRAA
jgi:hypothetical protein